MRFFKHFTNAHRGESLRELRDKFGFEGVGRYWTLVEMCAEKLEKEDHESYTEDHCVFTFNLSAIRQELAIKALQTDLLFAHCEVSGLFNAKVIDSKVIIKMPNLLIFMDRDSKRARTERAASAEPARLRERDKNKEKEKEIDNKKLVFDFENLYELYPNKINKAEGLSRLQDQIKTEEQHSNFVTAVQNYIRYLALEKNKGWLKAKNFDVFVGPRSKGNKPWHEWINPDPSVCEDSTKSGYKITRANLDEAV